MLGRQMAAKYQLYNLFDFSQNLMKTNIGIRIKKDIKMLQKALNETIFAEYHGSYEKAYGLSIYFPNKFMEGATILYRKISYDLDFPKNALWDEFLTIFVLSCEILK